MRKKAYYSIFIRGRKRPGNKHFSSTEPMAQEELLWSALSTIAPKNWLDFDQTC